MLPSSSIQPGYIANITAHCLYFHGTAQTPDHPSQSFKISSFLSLSSNPKINMLIFLILLSQFVFQLLIPHFTFSNHLHNLTIIFYHFIYHLIQLVKFGPKDICSFLISEISGLSVFNTCFIVLPSFSWFLMYAKIWSTFNCLSCRPGSSLLCQSLAMPQSLTP